MSKQQYLCVRCGVTYTHDVWHQCHRPNPPLPNNWIPQASGFDAPRTPHELPPPLTEERVRQIVREELAKREGS